jgi:hypothetical protein
LTGAYGSHSAGPHDAILPVVLPDGVARAWTTDPQLVAVLRASGVEVDQHDPEVALGSGDLPATPAAHRVALIGPRVEPGEGARGRDGIARASAWSSSTVRAAKLWVSARGAGSRELVRWDVEHRLEVAGAEVDDPRVAERAPRRAAVVVRERPGRWESCLDAVLAEVGITASGVLAKEALLVVMSADVVTRVALRAAAGRLAVEQDVIERTGALLPPALAALLPAATGGGVHGPVAWATQRRLPGQPPEAPLDDAVRRSCLDVLAALHAETGPPIGRQELLALGDGAAERLGASGATDAARAVQRVAQEFAETLADVRTVWGHGDLWHGNLLVTGDRLTGIVDWDGGGPGQLPLEDLFQLLAADRGPGGALGYGRALVDVVLPWAQLGGDEDARRLLRPVGLEPTASLLRALVAGAWLRRTASQLERYGDRARRTSWVAANVSDVIPALTT